MKYIRQFPMLAVLLLSALFLTGAGLAGRGDAYESYRQGKQSGNPISWVFLGLQDHILPWEVLGNRAVELSRSIMGKPAEQQVAALPDNDVIDSPERENVVSDNTVGEEGMDSQTQDHAASEETEGTEAPQEQVEPQFVTVDESYFDDALFIGDSRTVGLYEYAGLEERADFFCKTSLTIWTVLEKPIVKNEEGKSITVEEALQEKRYGKIYLMLGINELGRGNTELFMEQYKKVVERIRELQPDAVLFVEGIMRVAGEKSSTDPIFNNANINERNENIARLANNKDIFYIDVNEAVCDEFGDLVAEYTFDQIHLKAAYYELWKQFLLEHGIVP